MGIIKEETIAFKATKLQKRMIWDQAKAHGMKVPDFIRFSINFFSNFDRDFIEQIEGVADRMHLPLSTVFQNLLVFYVAKDKAILDGFGTNTMTYNRAFMFDKDAKLIEGNELSELIYAKYSEEIQNLKKKLEDGSKKKCPVHITSHEAGLLAERL